MKHFTWLASLIAANGASLIDPFGSRLCFTARRPFANVTMVFHDDEAASEARTALESIVDNAAVIIGN